MTIFKNLKNKPIILVGMMGSGKTAIGKRMAKRLEKDFLNLDAIIEEKEKIKIPIIFERHGEDYFRTIEQNCLFEALNQKNAIIATGGGAILKEKSREAIKEKSYSIWLNVSLDVLIERVSRNENRPLLKNKTISSEMEIILKDRISYYQQSDIEILLDDADIDINVNNVINALEKFCNDGT